MSVLYPLVNIIRALVQEKESKTREGMMMMALRGDALWMSWIFNFICLFLPLSILLTLIGKGMKLFYYSDTGLIFVYWITFFIASISYCFFISIFFDKALTGSTSYSLSYSLIYLHACKCCWSSDNNITPPFWF